MKKHWVCRLLALTMALLLALPCFAVAEDDVVITEVVESPIVTEEEVALDAAADEIAEEPAEAPVEVVEESAAEEIETLVEAPVEEAEEVSLEEGFAPLFESVVVEEEAAPAMEAAPAVVEDVVVVDDTAAAESDKAVNPNAPTAVAIDVSQGVDFWIGMAPSQLNVLLEPVGATTTLKWKSSKKKIAKVDANGLLTPRKAGSTKITVTTGNKKKSSVKVTVHKNLLNLNGKPNASMFAQLGRAWTIVPKSIERTAGYNYVAKFYLMNGLGKSSRINDFGIQMFVGDTLVAQKYLSKIKISCNRGKSKVFKVTFKGAEIADASARLLPTVAADTVKFVLTTNPTLRYRL